MWLVNLRGLKFIKRKFRQALKMVKTNNESISPAKALRYWIPIDFNEAFCGFTERFKKIENLRGEIGLVNGMEKRKEED